MHRYNGFCTTQNVSQIRRNKTQRADDHNSLFYPCIGLLNPMAVIQSDKQGTGVDIAHDGMKEDSDKDVLPH